MKRKQIVRAAILNDSESDVEIPNKIVEKIIKKKSKAKPIVEQPEKPASNLRPSFNFV